MHIMYIALIKQICHFLISIPYRFQITFYLQDKNSALIFQKL